MIYSKEIKLVDITRTSMKKIRKPKNIKILLTDVDGVLTDGGIYFNDAGDQMRKFHVRDGVGIKLA